MKYPSEIRLPSYSAFQPTLLSKVNSTTNIYANKYKMENETLKGQNKRYMEEIEKLRIENEKLVRKNQEL